MFNFIHIFVFFFLKKAPPKLYEHQAPQNVEPPLHPADNGCCPREIICQRTTRTESADVQILGMHVGVDQAI
jgi:hypothetical protein